MRVALPHGLTNSSRAFDRLVPLLDGFDVTAIDLPATEPKPIGPAGRRRRAVCGKHLSNTFTANCHLPLSRGSGPGNTVGGSPTASPKAERIVAAL